eukprot:CAMPEP_0197694770 /NCGR_PEP_ID=MMETSP1338-20131121/114260_1 /TAXON_ID=43686 ORGANISM="Pelagodinium beii, Strain RCC1491" /NCGR_SAMPLE_ID=MMETSP1338 /ASSEMBLY_ACC=CAM_ASM_000754 /LENGTH=283 /DNA_ID=CAMNT_0043277645 /DNA_START=55 /DNA_END=902 /DNA_ORIENTATION=+
MASQRLGLWHPPGALKNAAGPRSFKVRQQMPAPSSQRGTYESGHWQLALATGMVVAARCPSRRALGGDSHAGDSSAMPEDESGMQDTTKPNDRDVDREFTKEFDAFAAEYFSPRHRLMRWFSHRLEGDARGAFQTREPKPPFVQRLLAVFGYMLPLAGVLHILQPVASANTSLAALCAGLATLTGPVARPAGMVMATSWLLCGVADHRAMPSGFVRSHFRQALLLAGLCGLLALQSRLLEPRSQTELGLVVLAGAVRSGSLGALAFLWMSSVLCCMLGRSSVR